MKKDVSNDRDSRVSSVCLTAMASNGNDLINDRVAGAAAWVAGMGTDLSSFEQRLQKALNEDESCASNEP